MVEAMNVKPGENIEIHDADSRSLEVAKVPRPQELIARLRKYRDRLPADFKFDRLDTHERT